MSSLMLIGCDPELMIEDSSSNLKSAIPIIPGSKNSPKEVKNGAILSDNVNLEFNTAPAKSSKEFSKVIGTVLLESLKFLPEKHKLVVRASADFPKSELKDKRAQEFGCEPDFDAWELKINKVDDNAASKTFRSAGGHIHIGATSKSKFLLDPMGKIRMVKAMDLIVGITSIILDTDPTSRARRELYGRAGCHRPKEYGVEYRAIGNFWVKSPVLVDVIYSLTEIALKICLKNKEEELINKIGEKRIIDTINNSDVSSAKEIFDSFIKKEIGLKLTKKIAEISNTDFDFYNEWKLN